jgi:phosphoribosylglycinamide formyltransferase-1
MSFDRIRQQRRNKIEAYVTRGAPVGKLKIAVFASGRGSNFASILDAIKERRLDAQVELLCTNNPEAGALALASEANIPGVVLSRAAFQSREEFIEAMFSALKKYKVDMIVLAGYMKKVPPEIISEYTNRIINIHPALLPSFGGKGMFGHHVHEEVLHNGCKVTGVTVHIVDEVYDRGPIVAQRCVPVHEGDTPENLASRVLETEHRLYPEVLQLFAEGRVHVKGRVTTID